MIVSKCVLEKKDRTILFKIDEKQGVIKFFEEVSGGEGVQTAIRDVKSVNLRNKTEDETVETAKKMRRIADSRMSVRMRAAQRTLSG